MVGAKILRIGAATAILVVGLQAPSAISSDGGADADALRQRRLDWGTRPLRDAHRAAADSERSAGILDVIEELQALGLSFGVVVADPGENDSDAFGEVYNENDNEGHRDGDSYEFEILPGVDMANDVNNHGQIVASAGLDGFLIDDGVLTPIAFPGAFGTRPTNINESEEIIGFYALGDPSMGAPTFGFHRDRHGVFTTIEFPGAHSTFLWGLNNRGDIVGYFEPAPPAPPLPTPFMLDKHGEFSVLEIPGSLAAVAFGINDHGTINGGFLDAGFNVQGYLFEDGEISVVNFPDAIGTDVARTNNQGELVGTHSVASPDGADSSYLRSKKGVFSEFAFPGAFVTLLRSINERGDLSGLLFSGPMAPPQAFIAHRGGHDGVDN